MDLAGLLAQCSTNGGPMIPSGSGNMDCMDKPWTQHDISFCECAMCQQFREPIPEYTATTKPPDCDVTRNDPNCVRGRGDGAMLASIQLRSASTTGRSFECRRRRRPCCRRGDPDTPSLRHSSSSVRSHQSAAAHSHPRHGVRRAGRALRRSTRSRRTCSRRTGGRCTRNGGHRQHAAYRPRSTPAAPTASPTHRTTSTLPSATRSPTRSARRGPRRATRRCREIYLGVRCGNLRRRWSAQGKQAQPCRFSVRYVPVPQH